MCEFFSFVTDPEHFGGQRFFFNEDQRKEITEKFKQDSHSYICKYYGLNEDVCNKYEYNFSEKKIVVDQINSETNDSVQAEEWVRNLDISKIVILKTEIENSNFPSMLKNGDVLKFRPLEDIKRDDENGKIVFGWNGEGAMDYLTTEEKTFVIGQQQLLQYSLGLDVEWRIGDLGDDWSISLSMLQLVNK
jgi:hypothetical protein